MEKHSKRGAGKKRRPSIIGRSCRFDSKIRVFSEVPDFVSACLERNKNFFRKIEIFHFLPSKFAENWSKKTLQVESHKAKRQRDFGEKTTTDTPGQ